MDPLNILSDLIRSFAFALDSVIYSLIPVIYKLFIYLSEINLFSADSQLGAIVQRVYVFLGIFMLFKVSFSLIQYLIDPNSFSDSSKGFGKLVTNALVTIILLVSVPYIFDYAYELQSRIVTSNAIGQLVTGGDMGSVSSGEELVEVTDANGNVKQYTRVGLMETEQIEEMATDVQFLMYGAFFSVNPNAEINGYPDSTQKQNGEKNHCADSPIFGTVAMAQDKNGCLSDLAEEFDSSDNPMYQQNVVLTDFFKMQTGDTSDTIISSHRKFESFGAMLSWRDDDGEYVINYLQFISAIAGVYVVFLLLSYCVDVAVRSIKLGFLQMVAPIAIVSYIDPKETISNSKLHNWIKESATTYFSLFLRLAVIFLAMVLISAIASGVFADNGYISTQVNDSDSDMNIWIYLFLIIGVFMFAKKVPEMIENIFGIKSSGDLHLASAGKAMSGLAIGGALGTVGALTGAGAGRALTGAVSGLVGGARGKKMGEIVKGGADANRRMGIARANGSTFWGRQAERVASALGTQGPMGHIMDDIREQDGIIEVADRNMAANNVQIQNRQYLADKLDAQENRALKKIQDEKNMSIYAQQYRERIRKIETAKKQHDMMVEQGYAQSDIEAQNQWISHLEQDHAIQTEKAKFDYIDDVANGRLINATTGEALDDAEITGLIADAEDAASAIPGYTLETSAEKRHSQSGALRGEISDLQRANQPYERQKRAAEAEKTRLREEETRRKANVGAVQGHEGGARRHGGGPGGPGPGGPMGPGPRP